MNKLYLEDFHLCRKPVLIHSKLHKKAAKSLLNYTMYEF